MNRKVLFTLVVLVVLAYASSRLSQLHSDKALVFDKSNPPEILMLSTQSCNYCKKARAFFREHQLSFTELDIETSDKNMQMFQLLGGRGTPLIVIDGRILHGFEESEIRHTIQKNH